VTSAKHFSGIEESHEEAFVTGQANLAQKTANAAHQPLVVKLRQLTSPQS
jgi:hypothetical protein